MTAALSPAAAVAWVASLSVGVRAVAVLDAGGAVVAGDGDTGRRAAAALPPAPAAAEIRDGDLLVVRRGGHAVAAALGPGALAGVARLDLATAADALGPT